MGGVGGGGVVGFMEQVECSDELEQQLMRDVRGLEEQMLLASAQPAQSFERAIAMQAALQKLRSAVQLHRQKAAEHELAMQVLLT